MKDQNMKMFISDYLPIYKKFSLNCFVLSSLDKTSMTGYSSLWIM